MRKLRRKIKVVPPPESKKQYYFNIVITMLTAISLGVAIFSLFTTQEQLEVATSSYNRAVYSRRPIISIEKLYLTDSEKFMDGVWSPQINIDFRNTGGRDARKFLMRIFVNDPDFSYGRSNLAFKEEDRYDLAINGVDRYGPNESDTYQFRPKIQPNDKKNFYLCFEFRYYDEIMDSVFSQQFYYNYAKVRDDLRFIRCDLELRNRIRTVINNELSKKDYKLLPEIKP